MTDEKVKNIMARYGRRNRTQRNKIRNKGKQCMVQQKCAKTEIMNITYNAHKRNKRNNKKKTFS